MQKRSNIKLTLDQGLAVARDIQPDRSSEALASILGEKRAYLLRRSVDARRKSDVHFVVTAGVDVTAGNDVSAGVDIGDSALQPVVALDDRPIPTCRARQSRPIVVGMGPAGLFAALRLAEEGLCPIVIERGAPVEERAKDVELYHQTRMLNTASNVQFGEGGAGTFSDGKLTCGKNSPHTSSVLETFVAAGAPPEILWQSKPHIGTDVLGGVVAGIRKRIIACGGDVRFHTQLVDVRFDTAGKFTGVQVHSAGVAEEYIAGSSLVLACGHSARDTYALLKRLDFELEQKPFSMGFRIEHEQQFINRVQYGLAAGHPALGAADYKMACHLESGRSVYTFCMCPGGELVAASSEEGGLCVNGMSRQARDAANANAALLCNVVPGDYEDSSDPLSGINLQRYWEQATFCLGGGDWHAPAQRVGSFLGKQTRAHQSPASSYPLGVAEADLSKCLPAFAIEALQEALPVLDRKLKGFADSGALLTGIEARSSSPVRVVRDTTTLSATRFPGVYPCGEGAGYAGGIMSAAIDGIRIAEAIIDELSRSAGSRQ